MQPPANAFAPGTRLTVGLHDVVISQYLSQGGFAYVYSCTIDPPFGDSSTACLKRVVVPSKQQLTLLRQEVDAMKRLRGNAPIVSYIDSHASRLAPPPNGDQAQQYEVLLLMEYCAGKGLIDMMNTRLTVRLNEAEVVNIFGQITAAVAMCHHLHPPLIHRDIKIENVLLDGHGNFKLCDFGSAVGYSPVPANAQELQLLHMDIMQNTTPQYRAPEMIDLSRGFPIDDKSDIWALGVLLYKLCYYTTPFELPHQKLLQDLEQLILQGANNLRFPSHPQFSLRLQNVIRCCLREDPRRRPNGLQLLQEVCLMQGIKQIPDVVPYSVKVSRQNRQSQSAAHNASSADKTLEKPKTKKPETAEKHVELRKSASSLTARRPKGAEEPPASVKTDPFASLTRAELSKAKKPRPKSAIYVSGHKSQSSLQDLIDKRVSESTSDLLHLRKSEEMDRGTLQFLRDKEDDLSSTRHNTGGSFKASLKHGLRKISTGSSVGSHFSGSENWQRSKKSTEEKSNANAPKRSSSIQRRMALLLGSKDKRAPKTATGYGRFTDHDDIQAINQAEISESSTSSSESPEPSSFEFGGSSSGNGRSQNRPPPCPPSLSQRSLQVPKVSRSKTASPQISVQSGNRIKVDMLPKAATTTLLALKKAPPPKPSKPQHLKIHEQDTRRLSTSSDMSMPDLDDLEKQFARRFPSYV